MRCACPYAVPQRQLALPCAKLYPPCHEVGGVATATAVCQSLCSAVEPACSATERTVLLATAGVQIPSECAALGSGGGCYDGVNSSFVQRTAFASCQTYTGSICKGVVQYPVRRRGAACEKRQAWR